MPCVHRGILPREKIKNKKRQSIFNRFTSIYEQSCEVVGQLCVATDLLIGQKMTGAKGNNSLQPVDSAVENQIRKRSRVHKEQGGLVTRGLRK